MGIQVTALLLSLCFTGSLLAGQVVENARAVFRFDFQSAVFYSSPLLSAVSFTSFIAKSTATKIVDPHIHRAFSPESSILNDTESHQTQHDETRPTTLSHVEAPIHLQESESITSQIPAHAPETLSIPAEPAVEPVTHKLNEILQPAEPPYFDAALFQSEIESDNGSSPEPTTPSVSSVATNSADSEAVSDTTSTPTPDGSSSTGSIAEAANTSTALPSAEGAAEQQPDPSVEIRQIYDASFDCENNSSPDSTMCASNLPLSASCIGAALTAVTMPIAADSVSENPQLAPALENNTLAEPCDRHTNSCGDSPSSPSSVAPSASVSSTPSPSPADSTTAPLVKETEVKSASQVDDHTVRRESRPEDSILASIAAAIAAIDSAADSPEDLSSFADSASTAPSSALSSAESEPSEDDDNDFAWRSPPAHECSAVRISQGKRYYQEDRWANASWHSLQVDRGGYAAFAVFDGHASSCVSEHLRKNLLEKWSSALSDYFSAAWSPSILSDERSCQLYHTLFYRMQEEIENLIWAHTLDKENRCAVSGGVMGGSTALLAVLHPASSSFTVINVGDARAVLIRLPSGSSSTPDDSLDLSEMSKHALRVNEEHRGHLACERWGVESVGGYVDPVSLRVNDVLVPTRAFGDVHLASKVQPRPDVIHFRFDSSLPHSSDFSDFNIVNLKHRQHALQRAIALYMRRPQWRSSTTFFPLIEPMSREIRDAVSSQFGFEHSEDVAEDWCSQYCFQHSLPLPFTPSTAALTAAESGSSAGSSAYPDSDFLLLASDGFWDTITESEATAILHAFITPPKGRTIARNHQLLTRAVKALMDAAERSPKFSDNVTIQLVDMKCVADSMTTPRS